MTRRDASTRFLFQDADVRGNLLRADIAYRNAVDEHDYPPVMRDLVGQFIAGALLLAETIKFRGRLLLQARTDGPVRMIMAEANDQREVRAVARLNEDEPLQGDFPVLFYGGTLAVIIEPERGESYQSLVPLNGSNLAECLEHYFAQSEQLSTLIRLYANRQAAGGFLLQQLPVQRIADRKTREAQWQHLSILAATITEEEMQALDHVDTIKRLFVEEAIEVYEPHEVVFSCSCNEKRLANALVSLGTDELEELFSETPELELTCEFCLQNYRFDKARLMSLVLGDADTH